MAENFYIEGQNLSHVGFPTTVRPVEETCQTNDEQETNQPGPVQVDGDPDPAAEESHHSSCSANNEGTSSVSLGDALPELMLHGPESLADPNQNADTNRHSGTDPPERHCPPELREHQYEGLLISTRQSQHLSAHFKRIIEERVVLEDNSRPRILDLNDNMTLRWISTSLGRLEQGLLRSTFTFLFMTPEFGEETMTTIEKNEAFMDVINVPEKRRSLIPLRTQNESFRYPIGVRSLRPLDISCLYRDGQIVDPTELPDPLPFLREITALFNDRLHQKRDRENQQAARYNQWSMTGGGRGGGGQESALERGVRDMAVGPRLQVDAGAVNIQHCENVQITISTHPQQGIVPYFGQAEHPPVESSVEYMVTDGSSGNQETPVP